MSVAAKLRADVNELNQINAELKRLADLAKPLRQRKKIIEANVLQFMKQNGRDGLSTIRLNNVEVEKVEKKLHERLKKDEKEHVAIQLLQQSGVQNAKRVFSSMQELMKGKETTVHQLKLKDPLTGKKK